MTRSIGRGSLPAAAPRQKRGANFFSAMCPTCLAPANSWAGPPALPDRPKGGESDRVALTPPCGGGERNRTDDLLLAKQALSQLSYTPTHGDPAWRLERGKWWAREDLNLRPHAYQARALTT